MTQRHNESHDQPRIGREQAPEHGANFWGDLQVSLTQETRVLDAVNTGDGTTEMPRVAVLDQQRRTAPRQRSRRLWPVAVAAAVLAMVGLGALELQRPTDPASTTETVAGPAVESELLALDGPTSSDDEVVDGEADTAANDADLAPNVDGPETDRSAPPPQLEPTPADPPAVTRIFDPAGGAVGEPDYVPSDSSLSDDATFLANWKDAGLTWYAETDTQANCVDRSASEIKYVNGSGRAQDARDPQLRFTGTISHFVMHPEDNIAAWIVTCGDQMELYTATLQSSGRIDHLELIWLGQGSARTALTLWDGTELNLNAIEPAGRPFAIAYDTATDVITRDGNPTRAALEAGSPVRRESTPRAATADGGVSYWVGQAPTDTFSACPELAGSDQADTIWVRANGTWQPGLLDDTTVGRITAFALESTFSQVAFADFCSGQEQRLFLGTQRADGRISNVREVSLAPYVPGFATELFWSDAQTLRIEIDNSEIGGAPNRLDFRFDDGRQEGIIIVVE